MLQEGNPTPQVQEWYDKLAPVVQEARETLKDLTPEKLVLRSGCERDEGGSCCGAGLEDRYDGVTLLVNLLLGAELPARRPDPASCLFLGADGCRLLARDVICVNFICKKIADEVSPQRLGPLREREGIELEILFALHARLTELLAEGGDG